MRLCYITGSLPPMRDGVGDFAWNICRLLAETGFSELLTVIRPDVSEPENFQVLKTDFSLNDLFAVKKNIINFQPDMVLIEYPCLGYGKSLMINLLPALLKLTRPSVKIALTIHEYSNYTWKGKVRIALMSLAADRVMVTDRLNFLLLEQLKNNVKALLPVPPQIPLLIKDQYDCSKNDLVFSYWGFVRPNKGLHLLLPAFKMYQEKFKDSELLILADLGDSEYDQKLIKYLNANNLQNNVIISGFLEDEKLSIALSESDVCILPFTDGISDRRGTLKAALAMGIPVISTELTPDHSPEGLHSEENILLCQPDVVMIYKAMLMMNDVNLRNQLGRNALLWSKEQNWDKVATILRKVIID
ncbi:MAG: glycosyltransferase [Candidatus Cloacimonetes bacterium]|nr:glycosyltransferase [Candidatus Cloacimonadota bacterium]